ncbi:MAG: ComEA family DNA-binding protein [Verrucomicrobiae bacterium]|nr:ComEA family DNA-binding protein [Verrucomicrobiae bacterium]
MARIYGYAKGWPEQPGIDSFRRRLLRLEREAKSKGLGAWRAKIEVWDDLQYEKELVALPDLTSKVNINTASKEELLLLPGIGPVYSQRIISGRPYTAIEDLKKIHGIGPKTFDRIKDKVTLED